MKIWPCILNESLDNVQKLDNRIVDHGGAEELPVPSPQVHRFENEADSFTTEAAINIMMVNHPEANARPHAEDRGRIENGHDEGFRGGE